MTYYRFGAYSLMIIGVCHLAGHFLLAPHLSLVNNFTGMLPSNEVERQLLEMMNQYKRNVGGSMLSMMDLQHGLSLWYSLFFLWQGVVTFFLGKINLPINALGKLSIINCVCLMIGTVISIFYFFWFPSVSVLVAATLFYLAYSHLKREPDPIKNK
jgi:hypothetical protein